MWWQWWNNTTCTGDTLTWLLQLNAVWVAKLYSGHATESSVFRMHQLIYYTNSSHVKLWTYLMVNVGHTLALQTLHADIYCSSWPVSNTAWIWHIELCSINITNYVTLPHLSTKLAFCHGGPAAWNSLTNELRAPPTVNMFRCWQKT